MISNILFVYPDAEQDYYEVLTETLEDEFKDDNAEVTVARNLVRAKRHLQGNTRFDLVVTHIEVPLERTLGPDTEAGFKLESWLRTNNINIPIVVVVPKYDNTMSKLAAHPLSQIRVNDRSLSDAIISFARHRASPKKQLDIVLNLISNDGKPEWHYTIKGKNFPSLKEYDGELKKLNDVAMDNVIHYSEEVDNAKPQEWGGRVSRLRDNLKQYLITENDQFRMDLQDALRQVGSLDQTRVQFVVDEKVYPILLEAVLSPDLDHDIDGKGDYWMEHAPLVRYVSDRRTGYTLFMEEQRRPINVLIIGSDTSGSVDLGEPEKEIQLEKLDNIELECTELEKYLL